ncbi:rhomboid family intramembrane serine protease [Corynebacterium testudinoris]|uniref:Putative membrane protein n=1 Tax=Corynebacterium testudinoris TaxID=136857 RepID=A0A0G3HC95_9CORY|nr:putative membrane protein [Corynebacterium testudinoris]
MTQFPVTPTPAVPARKKRSPMRSGLLFAGIYVISIWAVHIINAVIFGGNLVYFGIHPLDLSSVWHIFTSPLLHANIDHLISNTVPGAIFSFLVGASGARVWWEVTAFVVILGGAGVWLLGGVGTNHIGASGLVYGWLAYLLVRGIFNRSLSQILTGVILGVFYSGLVWGVLPGVPGVSWQAHLFGAIGGIAAGVLITSDDPPALREKRRQKQISRGKLS